MFALIIKLNDQQVATLILVLLITSPVIFITVKATILSEDIQRYIDYSLVISATNCIRATDNPVGYIIYYFQ